MMEESGIETTPPASPTPPLTVGGPGGSLPTTAGKTFNVQINIPFACSLAESRF